MTTYQGPLVGEVVDLADAQQLGRVRVLFPSLSDATLWCLPALPPAAVTAVPELGSHVLVLWQNNDLDDRAFWIGVQPRELPDTEEGQVLARTPNGVDIRMSVTGETVTITSSAGPQVVLDGAAVSVSNGAGAHVALDGPSVDVNHGALVVT